VTFSDQSLSNSTPFKALLSQAASTAGAMLARVLELTRQSMLDDARHMSGLLARNQLMLCVKLLDLNANELCEQYPRLLESVFSRPESSQVRFADAATQGLRLEQLELMDEAQVQERVVIARVLQQVLMTTQSELEDLDRYVCAQQGLRQVSALHNPLRPDSFIMALHELMAQKNMPANVRSIWMQHMAAPLGDGLNDSYRSLISCLKTYGSPLGVGLITPFHIAAGRTGRSGSREPRVVWAPKSQPFVLTLGRLRRLMTKELDPEAPTEKPKTAVVAQSKNNREFFARQFAREFEDSENESTSTSEFDATVPAAFEALKEMKAVDQHQVMQRMEQLALAQLNVSGALKVDLSLREQLIRQAQGMAQVLGLEVVALMIDNLVQDQRLLEPVRRMIARLEPALLHLVRVDVRFFNDKEHPARRLLQEVSEQGLAFSSTTDPLFNVYLESLRRYVVPLTELTIESAQPFATAHANLTLDWELNGIKDRVLHSSEEAKIALKVAEQRNLLACKIAADMRSILELKKMPQGIVDFLLGPWSHVMAAAQLRPQKGDADLSGYKALVGMLLWSAQPEITSKEIDKLTQLMPRLLTGLRGGLRLIDYPSTKTSLFFDVLMKLHQQAFDHKSAANLSEAVTTSPASLSGSLDGWVAPSEAKASGFLAMNDEVVQENIKTSVLAQQSSSKEFDVGQDTVFAALSVGCWVELKVAGVWLRTQLTWISPQRTMYLFTNVHGKVQSMTKRMLLRLNQSDAFKVLSEQPVVEDALDAVVHTAMVNSLDLRLE
jgi:hypothetical protein